MQRVAFVGRIFVAGKTITGHCEGYDEASCPEMTDAPDLR